MKQNSKRIIGTGHLEGKVREAETLDINLIQPIILPEGTEFCKYIEMCNKPCFKKPDEYCGVRKFYEKYRNFEKGRYLGI